MTTPTEADVEQIALDWLQTTGWTITQGLDIAPDTPSTERSDYDQVVLEQRLSHRPRPPILHAAQGGKTEALCQQALAAAKSVSTLPSPHNAHLIALGAQLLSPLTTHPPSCPPEPRRAPNRIRLPLAGSSAITAHPHNPNNHSSDNHSHQHTCLWDDPCHPANPNSDNY